jgi:hypothetical protein
VPIRAKRGDAVGFKMAIATIEGFTADIRLTSSWQLVFKEKQHNSNNMIFFTIFPSVKNINDEFSV